MARRTQFPVFEVTCRSAALALAGAAGTLLSVGASVMVGQLVDGVAAGDVRGPEAVGRLAGYLVASVAAALASLFLTRWLPLRENFRREVDSSARVIDLVLEMPQRTFVRHAQGHYLNLATMAAFCQGAIVVGLSSQLTGAVLSLAALLAVAAWIDGALTLALVAGVCIYLLVVWVPSSAANRLQAKMLPHREAWLDEGRRVVEERRAVVASGAEGFFSARYAGRTGEYRRFRRSYARADTVASTLPASVTMVVQALVVAVCAALCAAGRVSVGTVAVGWQLAQLLQVPMSLVCEARSIYAANRVNVEQLRELEREAAPADGQGPEPGRGRSALSAQNPGFARS